MLLVRHFLTDRTVHRHPDAPAHPRVGVVLPTHARCRSGLLARAIDSVLAQTFGDFELLVMDDGSRDGSADLIRDYQRRDPRVVHVRHERNCGLPAIRCNEGIELTRGEFVAFQFDDDEWLPLFLETLVAAADRLERPALVCGQARLYWNERIGGVLTRKDGLLPVEPVHLGWLSARNHIANNAVLVPRAFFDRVGMFDPHVALRRLCDWDLWLRMAEVVPIHTVLREVARTYSEQDGGLGVTVEADQGLHIAIHHVPRNHLLTPAAWHDYAVDALRIGTTELRGELRRSAYETQIRPFYQRFRHHLGLGDFPLNLPLEPRDGLLFTDAPSSVLAAHLAAARARDTYRIATLPAALAAGDDLAVADLILVEGTRPAALRTSLPVAVVAPDGVPPGVEADAVWTRRPDGHPRALPMPATTPAFEAACRATEIHARTRHCRHDDGRPRVLLVGGDAGGRARLETLSRHGFAAVVEPGDLSESAVAALLDRHRPFLVESLGLIPAVGRACRERGLPHLATHPAAEFASEETHHLATITLGDTWPPSPWVQPASGLRWRCLRGCASAGAFALGASRPPLAAPLNALDRPLRVVLAGPAPEAALVAVVRALDGADRPRSGWTLAVLEAAGDGQALLAEADVLLTLPPAEGIPQAVKEALAARVLVVAAASPGLKELVHDSVTALLVPSASPDDLAAGLRRALHLPAAERATLLDRAAALARCELSPERFAADLFETYALALDLCRPRPVPRSLSARSTASPDHGPEHRSTEALVGSLSYEVAVPHNWAGVELSVQVAALDAPLPIHLEVADDAGRVVRRASAEAGTAPGEQTLLFRFPPLPCFSPVCYRLTLRAARPRRGGVQVVETAYAPLVAQTGSRLRSDRQRVGLAGRLL